MSLNYLEIDRKAYDAVDKMQISWESCSKAQIHMRGNETTS